MEKLMSINGNLFDFRTEDESLVSVLSGGYIITKEGKLLI